jgi:hypothetical protein
MYYVEHIKYYSDNSKWLAKLFLQFCHEYKYQFLMFETNAIRRRERFDWLTLNPAYISSTVVYFEPLEYLLNHYERVIHTNICSPVFYRHTMWRYFLITHQDHIPQYFKSYIGVKQLISELKKDGTRNDKRLENIFKILSIDNG